MRFMQDFDPCHSRPFRAPEPDTHTDRKMWQCHAMAMLLTLSACLLPFVSTAASSTGAGPRIIGGQPVPIGDYPFTVSLQARPVEGGYPYTHACGGALISAWQVVTARHCVARMSTTEEIEHRVVAGRTVLDDDASGEVAAVARILLHPGLADGTVTDVAVLELATPIRTIAPIPLLELGTELGAGTVVRALGWGMTGQDGATVTHMQMADIAVVEIEACMATSTEKPHPASDLCAVIPMTAGVCYGDSGGPLLAIDPLSREYRLAGLTSRGGTVCTVEPGVFTSMSAPAVWDWDWDQPR